MKVEQQISQMTVLVMLFSYFEVNYCKSNIQNFCRNHADTGLENVDVPKNHLDGMQACYNVNLHCRTEYKPVNYS